MYLLIDTYLTRRSHMVPHLFDASLNWLKSLLLLFPHVSPSILLSLWDPHSLRGASQLPLMNSQALIRCHLGPAAVANLETFVRTVVCATCLRRSFLSCSCSTWIPTISPQTVWRQCAAPTGLEAGVVIQHWRLLTGSKPHSWPCVLLLCCCLLWHTATVQGTSHLPLVNPQPMVGCDFGPTTVTNLETHFCCWYKETYYYNFQKLWLSIKLIQICLFSCDIQNMMHS